MYYFNIYMNREGEYLVEDDTGYLTTVDSFKAALMFIEVRRQLGMPKAMQFEIRFKGEL